MLLLYRKFKPWHILILYIKRGNGCVEQITKRVPKQKIHGVFLFKRRLMVWFGGIRLALLLQRSVTKLLSMKRTRMLKNLFKYKLEILTDLEL